MHAFVNYFSKDRKVVLIGHSFGGIMASSYAALYPERVESMILVEPGPLNYEMSLIGPKLSNDNLMTYMKALFESFQIKNPPDDKAAFDYVTGQLMIKANPGYWCNEIPHESVQGWRFSYDTYQNVIASFHDQDGKQINAIEGIESYEGPVLFMVGECNLVIGEEFQKEQMKYFNMSEIVVIPHSGHGLFAENPADSIKAINDFLD